MIITWYLEGSTCDYDPLYFLFSLFLSLFQMERTRSVCPFLESIHYLL